ncbi:MAG TPA: SDR family oxidoreductase [Candidatus Sulfotelmatobacter sp.]|nr:SDR family oxidoreductase [Candidatus Sulfotelmatobacter sp.]
MQEYTAEKSARLKNQVALVTGGGRGIGRAIARTLAGAGAAVAVLSRSSEELAETVCLVQQEGGYAAAYPADVTDAQAIQIAIRAIEQSLGPIDVLVNNAGTPKPLAPFVETDIGEWWRGMEVNLLGPVICTRHVLPGMISRRRGHIINISSGAGAMGMTNFSSYVCSKTALVRFTECLALENNSYGIAVFAIAPGTVRTAMTEFSLTSREGQKWLPWFKRLFDEGFTVPPERPATLVLELASGRADALSGRFISVYDDLEQLIANATDLQQRNLHALKVERLAEGTPNQSLTAIMAASRKVND